MALIQGLDYRITGGDHRCGETGCNANGMVACYQGTDQVWPRRFCVKHFATAEHLVRTEREWVLAFKWH